MHDMGLGKSLSYVFVPAYFASQSFVLFWVMVLELLQCQVLISYLCKWCYHTSMWIPTLLDHRGCHVNSFPNRCASLQVDPIIFNIRKINSKFSQRCLFHLPQVAFVFPPSHPLFFKDSDFLIKFPFYSCEVSPFFSINVLIRWFSGRY